MVYYATTSQQRYFVNKDKISKPTDDLSQYIHILTVLQYKVLAQPIVILKMQIKKNARRILYKNYVYQRYFPRPITFGKV